MTGPKNGGRPQWQKTGETTQTYVYDADGMRVRVTPSGGTSTEFLFDGDAIVEEVTGGTIASYVGPWLIARITGTTPVRTIFHFDALGNTRTLSDNGQGVTQTCIYDAYGGLRQDYPVASAPAFGALGEYRCYTDGTGLLGTGANHWGYYDPAGARTLCTLARKYDPPTIRRPRPRNPRPPETIGPTPTDPPPTIGPTPPPEPDPPRISECEREKCRRWCKNRLAEMRSNCAAIAATCTALVYARCGPLPEPARKGCQAAGLAACGSATAGCYSGTQIGYGLCMADCERR